MSLITLNTDLQQHYLQHEFASSATLVEAPTSWRESNKKIARDKTTGEFISNTAKDLQFYGSARRYILEADGIYGVNTKIRHTIVTQNPKDASEFFKDVYFIDLESIKDKEGILSCKADEGGLSTLIKARQNEKVEIDRTTSLDDKTITELETETITFNGRDIFLKSILEGNETESAFTVVNSRGGNFYTTKTPFPIKVKQNSDIDRVQTPSLIAFNEPTADSVFYLHNDKEKILNLKFDLDFVKKVVEYIKVRGTNQFIKLVLTIYENGSSYDEKESIEFYVDPEPRSRLEKTVIITENVTRTLLAGDSMALYFYTGARTGYNNRNGYFNHEFKDCSGLVTIEEDSVSEPTESKCIYYDNHIDRLLEIYTGTKGKFYSDLLSRETNGEFANLVVHPMLWVRGFDEKDLKKPSTSLKEAVDSACIMLGASTMVEKIGFNERLRLEPLDFFYNPNILIEFPNVVSELEREYASAYLNTSYEIGYDKGGDDYEEATGIGEYNGKNNYTNILDTKEQNLSLLSKYRSDSSAKEFARRKYKQVQEDTQYDDDWSVSDAKLVDGVLEERLSEDFDELPKGIYSPETATNLRLTPFQMLKRRWFFITGSLQQYASSKIMFLSSNCNAELSLKKDGVISKENQNTKVSDFGKSMFKPYKWKFKHDIDFDLQKKLRAKTIVNGKEIYNFYGVSKFKVSENKYLYGYLLEVDETKGEIEILEANI